MTNILLIIGFHKKKLAIYARNEKQVAAKFVELLVSSNLGLKNLQLKFERTNENDLFSNIKTSLKQGTIHILRKHFYSTKLNSTFKFFKKLGFFVKSK